MEAKTKKEGNVFWVGIQDASLSENQKFLISKLGEGVFLLFKEGAIDVAATKISSPQAGVPAPSGAPKVPQPSSGAQIPMAELTSEEKSLVSKLSRIKFEERTPPKVLKSLNALEQSALNRLIAKGYMVNFRSKKYPEGVYSISGKAYALGQPPGSQKKVEEIKSPALPAAKKPSLAINTFEHLVSMGYMVLSSEFEAREVMPEITQKLKNDVVKGVRGFDKKYYVLRKSFLLEYEKPIYALLESGLSKPADMAPKLKLTPEAVNVVLMILADEGDVIEKRRGFWAKA